MQANSWLYQFYSLHSKMHYAIQNSSVPSTNGSSSTSTPAPVGTSSNSQTYETNSTAPPTPTITSPSQQRNYTSQYGSSSSSTFVNNHQSTFGHSSLPSSETPALGLHPSHPNVAPSYYHNTTANSSSSSMSVSVNTPATAHQYQHGPFASHPTMPLQQYSPQAGTLPYQTPSGQTNLITPSTPPDSSHTDHQIKEEPVVTSRTMSKRSRNASHPEEEKRSKSHKKHSSSNHHSTHDQSFSNGLSSSHSNYSSSSTSTTSHHHPSYSAYHHGSMFGATGFSSADLSMVPSYYGGSMPYHHSQLAYPHHFQGKFSFFDHGTAGSNASVAGGSSVADQRHQSTTTTTSSSQSRANSSEEAMVLSSAFTSSMPQLAKTVKAVYPGELSDRRELDKVRSPESITSATSDYGSMTSQSPPSAFEKPFTSLQASNDLFDYSNSQYQHSLKNNWPCYTTSSHIGDKSGSESDQLSSSLHFSRLSSFQFWPGYSSVTSGDLSHDTHHQHHSSHSHHLPSVASTFPVDSLLHTHSTPNGVYGTGNLFPTYSQNMASNTYDSDTTKTLVNRARLLNKSDTKLLSTGDTNKSRPGM